MKTGFRAKFSKAAKSATGAWRMGGFTGLACVLLGFGLTLPAHAQQGLPVRIYQLGESVSAPYVTNITTSVTTLFSTNRAVLDGKVLHRFVQNQGTVPVLYAINFTNVSATAYHGVLAPGLATRDGLGSVLDLSAVRWPVSFRTESGSAEVSIIEIKQ